MSKMVSVNSIRSHASGMNAIALTTGFSQWCRGQTLHLITVSTVYSFHPEVQCKPELQSEKPSQWSATVRMVENKCDMTPLRRL
jgi:hypothetical protein